MADLVKLAERLNALLRRKLEVEAAVRMVDLSTTTERVRALKREHAELVDRIARLQRWVR